MVVCAALASINNQFVFGQFNKPFFLDQNHNPTNSNRGWVGIGTQTGANSPSNLNVNYNLHLHGIYVPPVYAQGPTGLIQPDLNDPTTPMNTKSVTHGVRFGMTNTSTGTAMGRGTVFDFTGKHFSLSNNESDGTMYFGTGNARFTFSQSNIVFGSRTVSFDLLPANLRAYANINIHNENGLYIRTTATGRYGLSVKVNTDNDIAMQCFGTNQSVANFVVRGNGNVFARKYTTTLGPIGDYVFAPNYYLMPLSELRVYIRENSHLPNVMPTSVAETAETDLVEFAKTLLVKIEENLLYILQLEERIKQLEAER
jgi:hypothetical protein